MVWGCPNLTIVEAEARHCRALAPYLREIDKEECRVLSASTPEESLLRAIRLSVESFAVIDEDLGRPICMYGVSLGGRDNTGIPWMLASADLTEHSKPLMRQAKKVLEKWMERFDELGNFVLADNKTSRAWLKRLGFLPTATMPVPLAPGKEAILFVRSNLRNGVSPISRESSRRVRRKRPAG